MKKIKQFLKDHKKELIFGTVTMTCGLAIGLNVGYRKGAFDDTMLWCDALGGLWNAKPDISFDEAMKTEIITGSILDNYGRKAPEVIKLTDPIL